MMEACILHSLNDRYKALRGFGTLENKLKRVFSYVPSLLPGNPCSFEYSHQHLQFSISKDKPGSERVRANNSRLT